MKSKWLAMAIAATLPAVALAQDAKENFNQDASAKVRTDESRAQAQRAQADADMQRAKQEIEGQAYQRALVKVREQKQIKAAWLGLSASQAPAALRRQLKLPDGTGLVIDFIQPDSPAAKASLKQYDLLTKMSGQILINSEQLSVLVRTFKPGNKVHLEFLREGERQSVDAELAEHEVPPLAEETGFGGVAPFQFQPPQSADRLRLRPDVPNGAGGGMSSKGSPTPNGNVVTRDEERHTLTLVDGKHQLSVEVSDGHRVLSVLDNRTGRIISKYPIDNDDQVRQLPADIRDPLKRLLPLLKLDNPNGVGKSDPDVPSGPDAKPGLDGPGKAGN